MDKPQTKTNKMNKYCLRGDFLNPFGVVTTIAACRGARLHQSRLVFDWILRFYLWRTTREDILALHFHFSKNSLVCCGILLKRARILNA